MHLQHSPYFRDRDTEYELCNDFPGDEVLIEGLHAMQCHFNNNGVYIDIPVVRVMNTVHYIAAYMLSTECSGDQLEYDVLAYDSYGRDKRLVPLTMIVLAAMLERTEGFRARHCRNVILDNRDPDFEEGVILYDSFLRSAEERFAEEDFLLDVNTLATRVQEQDKQIAELTSENIQLKYTITKMENQQNNQYNNCVIYNAPVYNTSTTNHYYPQSTPTEDVTVVPDEAEKTKEGKRLFCRITKAAYDKGVAEQVDDELRSASVSAPKLIKAIKTNEALGYTDTKNLNSSDLYDMLDEHYGLSFKKHHFTVCRGK